jgi:cytochrome b pre-mRNA-processing protein 3
MIGLFRRNPARDAAERAYRRVVAHARQPVFFIECGVPDTLDGRFELICMHAFLYLHRLRSEGKPGSAAGQLFFDAMFADFDRSLRELGTGDLSVGREIRQMAEAFYGRVRAYQRGLESGDRVLRAALERNLYGSVSPSPQRVETMAAYLHAEAARLRQRSTAELLAGALDFGLPQPAAAVASGQRS